MLGRDLAGEWGGFDARRLGLLRGLGFGFLRGLAFGLVFRGGLLVQGSFAFARVFIAFFDVPHLRRGGRRFTFPGDESDAIADVHLAAFLDVDRFQDAILSRLPLHCCLVGLDLGENFAGGHLVADFFLPTDERPLGHGVAQFRHLDFRHEKKLRVESC